MNQEKIGAFIADTRKSRGMSQRQLADEVGVTDKAVSKWETGKSLPEISTMESLCKVLKVSLNELLSGERLPEDVYSKKAEENMFSLIHESETKANNSNVVSTIFMIVLSFVSIIFIILYGHTDYFDGNISPAVWIDPPTIYTMAAITLLYLIGTKSMKSFVRAFAIVCGKTKYADAEIHASEIAVKMVRSAWLTAGVLVSALGYIAIATDTPHAGSSSDKLTLVYLNFALSSLGIVYGLIGYLLLIPIKTKLALYRNRCFLPASTK